MDIIVTVPRNYDMKGKLARYYSYWRIHRWPKKTEPGDHIYFVYKGEIRYKALISESQPGFPTEMDFENLEELSEPRIKMKGFQGYRYYNA